MQETKDLYNVLIQSNPQYIEEGDTLEFENSQWQNFALRSVFRAQEVSGEKIRLDVNQDNLYLFVNIEDFHHRLQKSHLDKNILILNDDSQQCLFYDASSGKTFQHFNENPADFLFVNSLLYFDTLELLKKHEHKEDHLFYFVDAYVITLRRIMFSSLTKEGRLTIDYQRGLPQLSRTTNYTSRCGELRDALSGKDLHFPKFIKAELCKTISAYEPSKRIVALFDRLHDILETANQNFEVYLSGISLEKFRTDYIEYKEKYFAQLRDILGKIATQVIALPVGVTAAAFATYKTTDQLPLFFLVGIAFFLLTFYSFFLIRMYKLDIVDIRQNFQRDHQKLTEDPFFKRFPTELTAFSQVMASVRSRSGNLSKLINIYSLLLSLMTSLFIFFCFKQFGTKESHVWKISIASFFALSISTYLLIWKVSYNTAADKSNPT